MINKRQEDNKYNNKTLSIDLLSYDDSQRDVFDSITRMKQKHGKRSISNRQQQHHHRSYPSATAGDLSSSHVTTRTTTSNRDHLGAGPAHLDSHALCLRPSIPLKNQKVLKRDLLRCSHQRPSLLGSQILQTPRHHHHHPHACQQIQSLVSTSTQLTGEHSLRQHALFHHPQTLSTTIDRIGPWPDVSIGRVRSNDNELVRPLKTCRHTKTSREFSSKYHSALSNKTDQFQFHSSTRTYIDDYRKQKGYLLTLPTLVEQNTLPSVCSSLQMRPFNDDEQYTFVDSLDGTVGDLTERDQTDLSSLRTERRTSFIEISQPSKHMSNTSFGSISVLPSITARSNHFQTPCSTMGLPLLTKSSMSYTNNINRMRKTLSEHPKSTREHSSKVYFVNERQQPK
jgi:hypothetical protein